MNAPIIDLLQGGYPEVIETYLEHSVMKCIAFNRRGTLLAAGCSDGICVVWDFQTRGIAKELKDEDCVAAITSVCWSKSGHHILVSSADNSLTLWNVAKGKKVFQTSLQQTPLVARMHPGGCGSSPPSLCLISSFSSAPFILDFHTKTTTSLPISFPESDSNKFPDGSAHYTPTAACFNKYGDLIYLGNSVGEILIIDHKNNKICAIVQISGGSVIKNIIFSRNGMFLLTNSSDRIIRIYQNLLPTKESLKTLEVNKTSELESLKEVGSKCLSLFREFQDSVTKVNWKAPCFSGDSEWVVGGSASKGEHKIYIWDRAGLLVKILEGPKEALVDLVWHPVKPIVVSVSVSGLLYIWVKDYIENWSAFAPDFRELEENEEFVEQEDEFDLRSDTEKVKKSCLNEDDEVDITTVEKDLTFSDSDISEEELCYLPVHPYPDFSENLPENNESGSPLSHDSSEPEYSIIVHSPYYPCIGIQEKLPESNKFESPLSHHSSETEGNNILDGPHHPCPDVPEKLLESNEFESPLSHDSRDTEGKAIICHPCPDVPEKLLENNKCGSLSYISRAIEVLENFVAEDASGIRSKKRRKRTKKLLELQDLKGTHETKASDCNNMEIVLAPDYCESMTGYEEVKPSTKLRSKAWDHFKKVKKPNNKFVAVCNYCSLNLGAGKAGTSNLRYHLRRKHAELIVSEDYSYMEGFPTTEDYRKVKPLTRIKRSKSIVWNHFKKVKKPNRETVAICNYCSRNFIAGDVGTSNLGKHLKSKHSEMIGGSADGSLMESVLTPIDNESISGVNEDCHNKEIVSTSNGDESMSDVKEIKLPSHRNELRSMVWNHFKKVKKPDNKVIAVCNYCSRNFVAGNAGKNTGTNNLRIHLKTKHAEVIGFVDSSHKKSVSTPNGDLSLMVFEEVKTPIHKSKSRVWDHFREFKKPDKEIIAVCNYCSKNYVAGQVGTSTLRYHLKRKHLEIFGGPINCIYTESVPAPNGEESVSGCEEVEPPPYRKQRSDESVSGCEEVETPQNKKQLPDESVSGCEEAKPPPNRKQRSMVWHHYKKVKKPDNKAIAVCNYCSRNFVAGAAGTNHLRNHLKRKHAKHVELLSFRI